MGIPTFSSASFAWTQKSGRTTVAQVRVTAFPHSFYIKSARTGQVMLFLPDNETQEANEFFDGEAQAYFSPGANVRVQIWH